MACNHSRFVTRASCDSSTFEVSTVWTLLNCCPMLPPAFRLGRVNTLTDSGDATIPPTPLTFTQPNNSFIQCLLPPPPISPHSDLQSPLSLHPWDKLQEQLALQDICSSWKFGHLVVCVQLTLPQRSVIFPPFPTHTAGSPVTGLLLLHAALGNPGSCLLMS